MLEADLSLAEPSDKTPAPAGTLIKTMCYALKHRIWQAMSKFLKFEIINSIAHRHNEMINVCCFKPLSFRVICYTAINDY
jgi:hypothetical protein